MNLVRFREVVWQFVETGQRFLGESFIDTTFFAFVSDRIHTGRPSTITVIVNYSIHRITYIGIHIPIDVGRRWYTASRTTGKDDRILGTKYQTY